MFEEQNNNKFENMKDMENGSNFNSYFEKYREEITISEKIHEFANFEIGKKESGGVHTIAIINENPEVNIEDYDKNIKKVFLRAYEIHPQIVKEIKFIKFSDNGKELFDKSNPECNENEEKAKSGLINGVNGERFSSNGSEWNGIRINYRGFKKMRSRYEADNSDIEAKSKINHFEMLLSHELFHNLNVLSQHEDSRYRDRKDDDIDASNKFDWMNDRFNENIKSLEFTGILSSKNYNDFVNSDGNIKERWKKVLKFKNIKNKEGEDVKCQINNEDLLRPEKDIIYPEKFISNYSREQVKKNGEEDFCDSMVAYAFAPEFLKEFDEKRGTKKFEWLEKRWGLYSKEKLESPEIKMDIYKKDSESASRRTE